MFLSVAVNAHVWSPGTRVFGASRGYIPIKAASLCAVRLPVWTELREGRTRVDLLGFESLTPHGAWHPEDAQEILTVTG